MRSRHSVRFIEHHPRRATFVVSVGIVGRREVHRDHASPPGHRGEFLAPGVRVQTEGPRRPTLDVDHDAGRSVAARDDGVVTVGRDLNRRTARKDERRSCGVVERGDQARGAASPDVPETVGPDPPQLPARAWNPVSDAACGRSITRRLKHVDLTRSTVGPRPHGEVLRGGRPLGRDELAVRATREPYPGLAMPCRRTSLDRQPVTERRTSAKRRRLCVRSCRDDDDRECCRRGAATRREPHQMPPNAPRRGSPGVLHLASVDRSRRFGRLALPRSIAASLPAEVATKVAEREFFGLRQRIR